MLGSSEPGADSDAQKKKRLRSPCIAVCAMDPVSGYCEGCLRTIDEISAWRFMEADAKLAILDDLPNRRIPGSESRPE
ncbi:MAG: DUF1289 domain-containing protein [bacterium]|nr:DUF1289 domain-containing protein [bacterium]